jgi:CP family cyanate transporter-like MFS transporter
VGRHDFRALALLWLAGAAARIPIIAVPPVLPLLTADLNMSGTEIGLLNGLPVVLFGIAAFPGAFVIGRLGTLPALTLGLLIAATAGALRAESRSTAFLYAMTALMGAGIAVAQPALPTLVRQWLPTRIELGTATYSNGMVLGPIAPIVLSLPLLLPLTGGWRGTLAFWSLPLLAIVAALFLAAPRIPQPPPFAARARMPDKKPRMWRLAWRLGLIFTGTNTVYFGFNAFAPGYLEAAGRTDLISPVLAAFNLGQLPATFLVGVAAHRLQRSPSNAAWLHAAAGIMLLTLLLALLAGAGRLGSWTIVLAAWLGFCNCTSLVFAFALPARLAAPADVPRLSAAMFTISYTCAMGIAVAGGAAWDLSGDARFAFLPIAASVVPMIVLRGQMTDDR